jgi:hypothetical protein
MDLPEWMAHYRLRDKNLTVGERERLRRERDAVLKRAKTSMSTIRIAHSRGRLGIDLATRLEKAAKGTDAPFTVLDHMPELRSKSLG